MNKIALVIGGIGMLSDLSSRLAQEYKYVGVVGRTKEKMESLKRLDNIVPVIVDYSDLENFKTSLNHFQTNYGKPSVVIAWVHTDTYPESLIASADCCSEDFYEVTGMAGANPNHISRKHEKQIKRLGIDYHRVILAKMGNRWLTNSEISDGVYEATKAKTTEYVVGSLSSSNS